MVLFSARFEARCLHNELRCGNGVCVPDFHRCHLEYSRQGHPLGCRDVTHLRDCGRSMVKTLMVCGHGGGVFVCMFVYMCVVVVWVWVCRSM